MSRTDTRNQAFEEAAKVCEKLAEDVRKSEHGQWSDGRKASAMDECAEEIRLMKTGQ